MIIGIVLAGCRGRTQHQIVFLIDKCSEYIKELKLTNNPRLWLEVAIIDLANLTENTSLAELQNRIARLEGGISEPVKVSAYKTAPAPVMKPEMQKTEHVKPDIVVQKDKGVNEEIKEPEIPVKNMSGPVQNDAAEDFSPMPNSKHSDGADISVLWGRLLENVHSAPTRALLKQWANPVKIAPDETILTMKNEIFLNQVQSGSKKQAIVDAVNALFAQENSNVIIRLPHADDVLIKSASAPETHTEQPKPKPSPVMKSVEMEPEVEPQEVEELKGEIQKPVKQESASKITESLHSDNVNMVLDVFEGKVID